MLSPENYIRKKVRSLPVYECWINADWEDSGMSNIIIARRHTNGNITFCIYLVDLLCLGVKDTHYKFNVTETEYQDFLEKLGERMELEIADYVLVHNIILSGIEFAEEYGFKPHKDFTSVTEFMLEEDTDDIELMEIECGKNGKPLYVQGPYDSAAKANKIMKQLESTAGSGNFDYLMEIDEDFENDFYETSFEENKNLFMELYEKEDTISDEEYDTMIDSAIELYDTLTDEEDIEKYYDIIFEDVTALPLTEELPDEILGIPPGKVKNSIELKKLFADIYHLPQKKSKSLKKMIANFREKAGNIPAVSLFDLMKVQDENPDAYAEKLNQSFCENPGYPLIRLLWLTNQILFGGSSVELWDEDTELKSIFAARKNIHSIEQFSYLSYLVSKIYSENNPSKFEALSEVIEDVELDENQWKILNTSVIICKKRYVYNYFTGK